MAIPSHGCQVKAADRQSGKAILDEWQRMFPELRFAHVHFVEHEDHPLDLHNICDSNRPHLVSVDRWRETRARILHRAKRISEIVVEGIIHAADRMGVASSHGPPARPKENASLPLFQPPGVLISRRPHPVHLGELERLIDLIICIEPSDALLETRLGTGALHLLWSLRFSRVTSIDSNLRHSLQFAPFCDAAQSRIVVGIPSERTTVLEVRKLVEKVDVLAIREAEYPAAISCFNMYRRLVRPGGAIVFFDSDSAHGGHEPIARFLRDLESGYVDGYPTPVTRIHQGGPGIAYTIRSDH